MQRTGGLPADLKAEDISLRSSLRKAGGGVLSKRDSTAVRDKHLENFGLLADVSKNLGVSLGNYRINQQSWAVFNDHADRGDDFASISKATGISELPALHYLANARQCIIKWGSDTDKVRDCLEGKIDP